MKLGSVVLGGFGWVEFRQRNDPKSQLAINSLSHPIDVCVCVCVIDSEILSDRKASYANSEDVCMTA